MKPSFFLLTILLGLFGGEVLLAQDAQTVRITHRFDWRRTVDQKYQGLVYGYLTGAWKITPAAQDGWIEVEARYESVSESRRNNALIEKPVDAQKLSRFRIDPKGRMTDFIGDGIPYYRNFPSPLPADAGPGSVWTGEGELVGDFLATGVTTRIPILIEYRWAGLGDYGGNPVIQVKTQYALRYQAGMDPKGDPSLIRALGSRQGMVSYDEGNHKVTFIRETTQEQYTSSTGSVIGNEGILLTFFEGVPALGTASLVASINQALGRSETTAPPPALKPGPKAQTPPGPDPSPAPAKTTAEDLLSGLGSGRLPQDLPEVKVEADPRGVKLTLENLRFVADQAVLVPGEDGRLKQISQLLKSVPGRNILVVGHTAAVGTVDSQEKLSVDRALAIVQKLKAAGIPAQTLLYQGRGGREPVASNDTEAGRAQNRRVEILILDQ